MDNATGQRLSSRWPWVAASLALLLFALTSTSLPVPELSAGYLADALRLTPFPSMQSPLWGALIRGLAAIRPDAAVALANGLSLVLGALCVGLLARLIECSLRDVPVRSVPGWAPLAGMAGGLMLAASIPFWLVSNRAHPATLGLALLLVSLNLIQHFRRRGTFRFLVAGTLFYAVGLADWPSMMLLAPLVAGQVLLVMWQQQQLKWGRVALLVLVLLTTPLLWWLIAWDYARLPAAAWREMEGVGDAFRYGLLTYRDVLLRMVPRQGWLILLFTSVLPWLVAMLSIRSDFKRPPTRGALVLQLLVFLLVLALLWNAPLSPWALLGTQPLMVMPYVLMASSFAYLVAYGAARLAMRAGGRWLTGIMSFVLLMAWGVALVRSIPEVSTESAPAVRRITDLLQQQLGDRDLVISHGILSDHQRLLLFQRGQKITLLEAPLSELSGYRRYLSSLFADPRQRSLGLAGLMPVLMDWMATEPRVTERLAVEPSPDVWLSEGFEPLPLGSFFAGTRVVTTAEVAHVRAEAERFWPQAQAELKLLRRTAPRLKNVANALATHWARVANDTGVFFENHHLPDQARLAYAQARQLDPENISAAANLVVLGQASGWIGIDVEEADLALAVAPRDRPLPVVINRYGHLRRREAAQMLGASVGPVLDAGAQPDADWQDAVEAYRRSDRMEARRRLEKMINQRPEFDPAWILLAHVAYEQGDDAVLQKCVRQMREMRREWPEITVLLGRQALERQDISAARDYFERASQLRPTELSILELLMQLDLHERDFQRAENRTRQMLANRPDSVWGLIGLGTILRHQQRLDLAEHTLQRVLDLQRHPQALAELALVKDALGQTAAARALAEEAVQLGPRLPVTHEAEGILLWRAGSTAAALDCFSRALALDGQRWATRVYLAAALNKAGRTEEARVLAKQLRKERHAKDGELDELLATVPE